MAQALLGGCSSPASPEIHLFVWRWVETGKGRLVAVNERWSTGGEDPAATNFWWLLSSSKWLKGKSEGLTPSPGQEGILGVLAS